MYQMSKKLVETRFLKGGVGLKLWIDLNVSFAEKLLHCRCAATFGWWFAQAMRTLGSTKATSVALNCSP